MANLKNINETELLKRIEEARQQGIHEIELAANAARTDVTQAVDVAKTNVPGLLDLATRADIAFVVERTFGGVYGSIPDKDAPPRREQFSLTHEGGWGGPLGEANVKPGRYRVFLFALRIE